MMASIVKAVKIIAALAIVLALIAIGFSFLLGLIGLAIMVSLILWARAQLGAASASVETTSRDQNGGMYGKETSYPDAPIIEGEAQDVSDETTTDASKQD